MKQHFLGIEKFSSLRKGRLAETEDAQQEMADAQWTWKCPAGAQQEIVEAEPKYRAQRILAEE